MSLLFHLPRKLRINRTYVRTDLAFANVISKIIRLASYSRRWPRATDAD